MTTREEELTLSVLIKVLSQEILAGCQLMMLLLLLENAFNHLLRSLFFQNGSRTQEEGVAQHQRPFHCGVKLKKKKTETFFFLNDHRKGIITRETDAKANTLRFAQILFLSIHPEI